MRIIIALSMISVFLSGCDFKQEKKKSAQDIVDKAIESSGKAKLKQSELSFEFRGKTYQSIGDCSDFILKRVIKNSDVEIIDTYEPGKDLKRVKNDSLVSVADSTANKISESINSVHYFVQLPYRLNDEAVQKTYLGLDTIRKQVYHNIKVTFKQTGGGTDYQDVYMYWFGKDDYKLDYLAYSFEVNEGGIRFREAFNERLIEGIRFVDYKNYKPKEKGIELVNVFEAFKNNELELLSKIENKEIKVKTTKEKC